MRTAGAAVSGIGNRALHRVGGMRKRDAFVLWEGPSPCDGAPIVAIATSGSVNEKTGRMVQVWILRADQSPIDAVRSGADEAICGRCPMRGDAFTGRACYVNVAQGPSSVWRKYHAGGYERLRPREALALLAGEHIRWGAYGDPAMLPEALVRRCNEVAAGHTGYTHQWRHAWAQWSRGVFMASCETPAQEQRLRSAGWGTFRAGRPDGTDIGAATLCLNERDGTTCKDCGACDGRALAIYIPAHGAGKNMVPAERLARRKMA